MHSILHATNPPSLHYVGFIVKTQAINLSDTCQHAVILEFFTSKTACSAPASADFALFSACLEGMNEVERRQEAQFQAFALRAGLGSSLERYLALAGPLNSRRATPRAQC